MIIIRLWVFFGGGGWWWYSVIWFTKLDFVQLSSGHFFVFRKALKGGVDVFHFVLISQISDEQTWPKGQLQVTEKSVKGSIYVCVLSQKDSSFSEQCGEHDIPIYVFKIQFSTYIDYKQYCDRIDNCLSKVHRKERDKEAVFLSSSD